MTPGSIRLYVAADLAPNSAITLSADQAGYLGRVMRRGPGDPVHLFNAAHGEWAARIETLRRDQATLRVETRTRPPSPEPDIHLVFAPLRRDATEWVVQKATELGVAALLPVLTTRSVALRINPDRLRAIATEAAEQCERLSVPVIHPLQRLDPLLASWPPDRRLVAALERTSAPPVAPATGPAALLIGPEGGFTTAELDGLARRPFVAPATLGPRILRAETAALVGLARLIA